MTRLGLCRTYYHTCGEKQGNRTLLAKLKYKSIYTPPQLCRGWAIPFSQCPLVLVGIWLNGVMWHFAINYYSS